MTKHFKCKFLNPKDFLGFDLTLPRPGEITLSMRKGVAGILAKIVMVKVKPSLLAQGSFYAGKEFP